MSIILLFFVLILSIGISAQSDTQSSTVPEVLIIDSSSLKIPETYDRITREEELTNMNGINYLVRYQNEQRAKEKRRAMLRIGLGLAFLAILIIGLSRRRKKS